MSKRFRTQDSKRYKKLGMRWRRPVGSQSKLRKRKAGAGMKVSIGYGTPKRQGVVLIRNEADFLQDCSAGVLLASGVGSKKVKILAEKAKELNIVILNRKKVKRALRMEKAKKKDEKKKKKTEAKETKTEVKEVKNTQEAKA